MICIDFLLLIIGDGRLHLLENLSLIYHFSSTSLFLCICKFRFWQISFQILFRRLSIYLQPGFCLMMPACKLFSCCQGNRSTNHLFLFRSSLPRNNSNLKTKNIILFVACLLNDADLHWSFSMISKSTYKLFAHRSSVPQKIFRKISNPLLAKEKQMTI